MTLTPGVPPLWTGEQPVLGQVGEWDQSRYEKPDTWVGNISAELDDVPRTGISEEPTASFLNPSGVIASGEDMSFFVPGQVQFERLGFPNRSNAIVSCQEPVADAAFFYTLNVNALGQVADTSVYNPSNVNPTGQVAATNFYDPSNINPMGQVVAADFFDPSNVNPSGQVIDTGRLEPSHINPSGYVTLRGFFDPSNVNSSGHEPLADGAFFESASFNASGQE